MAEYEDLRNAVATSLLSHHRESPVYQAEKVMELFNSYLEELGELKRKLVASEAKQRVTQRALEYAKAKLDRYHATLLKIANGMIDTGFVDTPTPDWYSAYGQLQSLAQDAIADDKLTRNYQREVLELARGIQIAHAAWLAMGAPGAWDKADG
jgi:hypothetical protein